MSETKELTLTEHAMQEIDAAAAGIADLVKKYDGVVYDVTTTKGMAEAKEARKEIRAPRYAIEQVRKAKGSELKAIATAINTRAAELTEQIEAIEGPIHEQIKAEEDRKEAERAERERIERERVQAMVDGIAAINAIPGKLFGAGVSELTQAIHDLRDNDLAWADEVYAPSANKAKQETLERLVAARDEREELDRQAAENLRLQQEREAEAKAAAEKLAAERAAFEAEQAEARKAQEEADRKAAEARAEADRAAQAERDRQAEAVREEQARAQAELDRQAEEARQQREREEAELAERRAEIERQEAEARQKAADEAAERARVAAEEQSARDEEARQERAQRESEAIATATLYAAAEEARDLLATFVPEDNLTLRKLTDAIRRENQA